MTPASSGPILQLAVLHVIPRSLRIIPDLACRAEVDVIE